MAQQFKMVTVEKKTHTKKEAAQSVQQFWCHLNSFL